ncbi:MAG: DUF3007 family protein [Coleofasciculaceae cyanobacterium SM2_1_6]|nr:DUF3007 family protein [Coleofasciculaceae cyanobacterium SM2_1_6]
MRRIDAIAIGVAIFLFGGVAYGLLQAGGLDSTQAGIWSQAALVLGLLVWLLTYLVRVGNKNMTYNQQRNEYEEAMISKRLAEMTPEELEKLQAEIEIEKNKNL